MKTSTIISLFVLAVAAGGAVGYHVAKRTIKPEIIVRTDTLTQVVTHTVEKPVPYAVYTEVHDSVLVQVPGPTDTVYVSLPREVREYRDSCYFARVSGIQPSLDLIETYNRTVTVTRTVTEPAPRLSFGVQVGVGAVGTFANPVPSLGYYVGVGGQWRFGKK